MDTLLIAGASGFLGSETARQAVAAGWRVVGTFHSRTGRTPGVEWRRLDVTDRAAVDRLYSSVRPSAVISSVYGDWAVHAEGVAHLALAATAAGARLVHVSSDAVHAGRPAPYTEADRPEPITPYGAAKAAGETVVRAVAPGAAIVRTSLILGDGGAFERRLLAMAAGEFTGVLFTEELRCPLHVSDLAAALLELLRLDHAGVLNVAGPEALSRYDLGRILAPGLGVDPAVLRGGPAPFPCPGELRLDTTLAASLLTTRLGAIRR